MNLYKFYINYADLSINGISRLNKSDDLEPYTKYIIEMRGIFYESEATIIDMDYDSSKINRHDNYIFFRELISKNFRNDVINDILL